MSVARKLDLGVVLYNEGRLNKQEIYKPRHFSVEFDKAHNQVLGVAFKLFFRENGFDMKIEQTVDNLKAYNFQTSQETAVEVVHGLEEITTSHRYDEWIETNLYRFRIARGPELKDYLEDETATSSSFHFLHMSRWRTGLSKI